MAYTKQLRWNADPRLLANCSDCHGVRSCMLRG